MRWCRGKRWAYGLFSSFNSVGGTKGKLRYYTFYQYKRGDGFRPNSHFDVHTAFAGLDYNCLLYTSPSPRDA